MRLTVVQRRINKAYYDAWVMSNLDGVKSNIDWNEAPALEFLGAPGLNRRRQKQIQAVLANVATVIYSYKNPLQHRLHVRCDDPRKRCDKRPANDPCEPNPPNHGDKPKKPPNAYSMNSDPDDGYPMINFCKGFMGTPSLNRAFKFGNGLKGPNRFAIDKYANRGTIFLHELTHLDLAADSAGDQPNPQVYDMTITLERDAGGFFNSMVYGGHGTKLLARYQDDPGYYVQRNADNFAFFVLAKYIMSRNGNIYPHLPIILHEIEGPPWRDISSNPSYFMSFANDSKTLYLNTSNSDLSTLETKILDLSDYPGCSDRIDSVDQKLLTIDKLAPLSAYPSNYTDQLKMWITDLSTADLGTGASTTTAPASAATKQSPPPPSTSGVPPPAGDTCDWYTSPVDHFEIYGKNFDSKRFNGSDGSGLAYRLQGCGDLT